MMAHRMGEERLGDGNVYAEARRAGHRVDDRLQVLFVIAVVGAVVLLLGLVVPQHIFDEGLHHSGYNDGYTFAWFARDLQENVNALFGFFVGDPSVGAPVGNSLITYAVILLAGGGLALCGALYQSTFRNALVTPSTLGVMSGAVLGMGLWVVFFYQEDASYGLWFEGEGAASAAPAAEGLEAIWQSYGLSLCSFAGCVVVVGLVLLAVRLAAGKSSSGIMMIVTGQVIGGVMGAVMETLRYYYITVDPEGEKALMLKELQISSFYRVYTPLDIAMVGLPLLLLFVFVMGNRRQLTLLAFSEGEARSMGVETRRLRYGVVALATLLTAIIVSFCGRVGFVGFIVPHLARRLVGANLAYLLPASLLLGGVFVLTAYVLMNIVLGPAYTTMAGMFVSIAGAVVFLATALKGKGEERGSF